MYSTGMLLIGQPSIYYYTHSNRETFSRSFLCEYIDFLLQNVFDCEV